MNVKVLNIDGASKSQNLKLSDSLVGLKVNNRLLKYVIDWQLNRSKKRIAKMRLLVRLEKFMPKKELAEQGTQVEKLHYL